MLAKSIKHRPFMVVSLLGFQTEQPKQLLTKRNGKGAEWGAECRACTKNHQVSPSRTRTTTVTGLFSPQLWPEAGGMWVRPFCHSPPALPSSLLVVSAKQFKKLLAKKSSNATYSIYGVTTTPEAKQICFELKEQISKAKLMENTKILSSLDKVKDR